MKTALALLLIALPMLGQSRDILFKRLENLNDRDEKKCLEVAERYMKIFPDNAASYYFACIIFDGRADKSRSIEGKYRNLKRAVDYAITFEEKDNGDLASEVQWADFRDVLTDRSKTVVDQLEAQNEKKYSADLLSKLEKLDANRLVDIDNTNFVAQTEMSDFDLSSNESLSETESENVSVNTSGNKQFFGMPNGTEIVKSASLTGEQDVLRLINAERAKKGMGALEWDENLAKAARYHAYDLATQDYFDHQSYDRKNSGSLIQVGGTFDRIRKFYSASFANSENIAAGNKSPQATYQQWYNSKGHYDNMFNPSSKKVGLGVFYDPNSTYGYYWVFCSAL